MKQAAQSFLIPLAELARRKPHLAPSGVDPNQLYDRLLHLERVRVLLATIDSARQQVEDTVLSESSQTHKDALDVYGVAEHSARRDPDVEAVIGPMRAALATGKRVKKPTVSPPSERVQPATLPAAAGSGTAVSNGNGGASSMNGSSPSPAVGS